MKKFMFVLTSGILILSVITCNVKAQSFDKAELFASIKKSPDFTAYVLDNKIDSVSDGTISSSTKENVKKAAKNLKASKANLALMKATYRANENFKKSFKDVADANWQTVSDGMIASFQGGDNVIKVCYNAKGRLLHTMYFYPVDKTPQDIRSIVENDYPYDDIVSTIKVDKWGTEFYIFQLENKNTIRQISVCDGETHLINEFTKSH